MIVKKEKMILLEGSYTVEAAFLVPLILGIFFAWLFQLFYLHDTVIIDGMLMEAVIEQEEDCREKSSGTEGEKTGNNRIQEQVQKRLWLMHVRSINKKTGVAGSEYILKSDATWNIPIMRRFLGEHFTYKKRIKIKNFHPETLLRGKGGQHGKEDKTQEGE